MTARYATIISIIYIAAYMTGCEQSTVYSIEDDLAGQDVLPERGEMPLPVVDLQPADSPVRQQPGQSGAFSARSRIDWKPFKGLLKQVQRKHETEYVAMFSVREAEGGLYTYHTSKLTFSDFAMKQAGGRGRPFLYEVESPGGTLPRLAVAWIPDSDRAVNEMNLWMQPTRYRLPEKKQTDSDVALPSMGSSCSEIIETVYICSYNGDFHHSCEEVIVITESCGGGGGGGTTPDDPFGDDDPYDDPWNWPDPDCDGPEGCGGGGGSGGGGGTTECDPNAILPPVGCEEPNDNNNDELAFLGDITIDASVLNNPKAKCVLDGLFEGETNTLSETIVKFADESVNLDLVIELADLGPSDGSTNGALDSTNPSSFRLQLNQNRIDNRTPIEIAATYLHEAIHAEMRRFLHGATDTSTLPGFPGDFNDDWRHYILSKFGEINIENLSDAEHHAMALNYVSRIAEGLADFDNHTLSISHYEAIAWIGLVETEAWNNLSSTERSQLGASYQNVLNGRSLECN